MKKNKISTSSGAAAAADSTAPLSESVAAAARRLMGHSERESGSVGDEGADLPRIDSIEVDELKKRCAAFGIDASTAELLLAGLHLLTQQTETALEVAMLQSLRADRTFGKRRAKR